MREELILKRQVKNVHLELDLDEQELWVYEYKCDLDGKDKYKFFAVTEVFPCEIERMLPWFEKG